MPIQASVVDTQTVVTLTEKALTVAFPTAGLTIVKIFHNGQYIGVPIDASKRAIFPNCGGKATTSALTQIEGTGRPVTLLVTGTTLNYFGLTIGTSLTSVFYYGTPLDGALDYKMYAGVVAASTLSGGSGSATFTFPSGNLKMTGFAVSSTQTAATTIIQAAWATESGKTFNGYYPMNIVTQNDAKSDILGLDLPVSITVAVTITLGTGADVIYLYGFYQ